jgi:hypothetical protein
MSSDISLDQTGNERFWTPIMRKRRDNAGCASIAKREDRVDLQGSAKARDV